MDDFEQRLKVDARHIKARVPDELARRIDASIAAAERAPQSPPRRRPRLSMLWFSALTGVACALLLLTLAAPDRRTPERAPGVAGLSPKAATTVPNTAEAGERLLPLNATPAAFAEPLEDELQRLRSDLEKVRETVEKDLVPAL